MAAVIVGPTTFLIGLDCYNLDITTTSNLKASSLMTFMSMTKCI